MLATAQTGADFKTLDEASKRSLKDAIGGLELGEGRIELPPSQIEEARPLPAGILGVVDAGVVSIVNNGTVVSTLDAGDLILPDNDLLPVGIKSLRYVSEGGAVIRSYDRDAFMAAINGDERRAKLWLKAVFQHVSLLLRVNALHLHDAVGLGGTPEVFASGAIIIQQGDPADDVFSLTEGLAEVLVNGMLIAKIRPGELFGTMAALTGGERNATVRAAETCSVLRVPRDRFFELIRSRPAAVQGLLVDMAKSISDLNEEVVALRRQQGQQ